MRRPRPRVKVTSRDPEVPPDEAHVVHALRYLREIGKRILREEREAEHGDGKTNTPNDNETSRRRD
jgi:hypothetical protein